MIKATELRIGNLVMFGINTAPQMVFKIDYTIREGHLVNGQVPEDHVHPIPLTPELLQKCGWTTDEIAYFKDDITLFRYKQGISYSPTGSLSNPGKLVPVDSLHQLQNLYFALTGSEIEVNL